MIVFGQKNSLEVGVLLGGSLNSLNYLDPDDEQNMDYKTSLTPVGGGVVQYNFTKRFSIKSKLLYHIKGERLKFNSTEGTTDFYKDFHYVTLPLLAQLNFSKNKWGGFCNTGFYLAGLIKTEKIYKELEGIEEDLVETYPSEKFNKFDFGIALGYGVSFQANERIRVFLESTLDYGLTNISKVESSNKEVILSEVMTGTVGIAYSFTNKRKVFNGTSKLECADHEKTVELDEKKKSKWRLVLYKDGKKVGKKTKKGKSRLFKKKN